MCNCILWASMSRSWWPASRLNSWCTHVAPQCLIRIKCCDGRWLWMHNMFTTCRHWFPPSHTLWFQCHSPLSFHPCHQAHCTLPTWACPSSLILQISRFSPWVSASPCKSINLRASKSRFLELPRIWCASALSFSRLQESKLPSPRRLMRLWFSSMKPSRAAVDTALALSDCNRLMPPVAPGPRAPVKRTERSRLWLAESCWNSIEPCYVRFTNTKAPKLPSPG